MLLTIEPAHAGIVITCSTTGGVLPTDPTNCSNPFAGCELAAMGRAEALTANRSPLPGPWGFIATFRIVAPLSATTFRTTGEFAFDDSSAADNDF